MELNGEIEGIDVYLGVIWIQVIVEIMAINDMAEKNKKRK